MYQNPNKETIIISIGIILVSITFIFKLKVAKIISDKVDNIEDKREERRLEKEKAKNTKIVPKKETAKERKLREQEEKKKALEISEEQLNKNNKSKNKKWQKKVNLNKQKKPKVNQNLNVAESLRKKTPLN